MSETVISVDIGGTRLRAARLDTQLNILQREEKRTLSHEGLEPTLQRIKDLIRSVLPDDGSRVQGIGISAAGPLNPDTGVVVAPPNLHGWHNVPLGEIIQAEFNLPVYVGNDANVAALAEAALGAAKGTRYSIYLTISTGIGSGMINDGRLVLGNAGVAAEAGHIIMVVDEGTVSSLEKEAAGPAIARKARARMMAGEATILSDMAGGNLEALDARMVGDAANQGDALAKSLVAQAGRMIGLGIVSLLHLFNPEVIVIGGGVSYIGDLLFDPIRETIREYALDSVYWDNLQVIHSQISEDVSILGAATLVLTEGGVRDLSKVLERLGLA